MKLNQIAAPTKPFVNDGKLTITTLSADNKVTGFEASIGGVSKRFPTKNFKILAAWRQVELWAKSLK